jgi:hypothetical protein
MKKGGQSQGITTQRSITFMQNKPNFQKPTPTLNLYSTKDYENQSHLPAAAKQTQSNPFPKAGQSPSSARQKADSNLSVCSSPAAFAAKPNCRGLSGKDST